MPSTHYYQLAVLSAERNRAVHQVALAIEPLAVDAAYATDRIVYRKSRYRLDYYHYHRWSAAPALHLYDYLREAYRRTGQFSSVTSPSVDGRTLTLRGRLIALEEVDHSEADWVGRVALELELHEPSDGRVLWSLSFVEEEPLEERSPEGLARALSVALQRIVDHSAEEMVKAADARDLSNEAARVDPEAGCPRLR